MDELPALIVINDALLSSGMKQDEIDRLLAKFLEGEEEALDYLKGICEYIEKENTVLTVFLFVSLLIKYHSRISIREIFIIRIRRCNTSPIYACTHIISAF